MRLVDGVACRSADGAAVVGSRNGRVSSWAASDDEGWAMSDLNAFLIVPFVAPWSSDLISGRSASLLPSELGAGASLVCGVVAVRLAL